MAKLLTTILLLLVCHWLSAEAKPTGESSFESDDAKSFYSTQGIKVSGCPTGDNGELFAVYGSPPKCYPVGEKGSCNKNEKLFLERGSLFGICSCECINSTTFDSAKMQICRGLNGLDEYVHIPELKSCFRLQDQGPCEKGERLVLPKHEGSNHFQVSCEGPKKNVKMIRKRETSKTNKLLLEDKRQFFKQGTYSLISNGCPAGMVYSHNLDRCLRKVQVHGFFGK